MKADLVISEALLPTKPNYDGGSIVNLMTSIINALKKDSNINDRLYQPLNNFPSHKLTDTKRIALIVVDGLGQNLYSTLRNRHSLEKWALDPITSVFPPTTASAITTFLTGTAPQQHGLTGWYMYLKELTTVATILPFVSRENNYDLEQLGVRPLDLTDCRALSESITVKSAFLQPSELCDSAFSRSLTPNALRKGYRNFEQFREFLEGFITGKPDLDYLYAYIPNIDTLAHKYGPYSEEVDLEYVKIASMLSSLCELSDKTGTLLLITADHGFIHNPKDRRIIMAEHPALKEMLTLPLCGEPRTAYAYVKADRNNDFLQYIESHLQEAVEVKLPSDMMSQNCFGKGPPHKNMKDRIGDYILCMKENYAIYDPLLRENVPSLLGVHGGSSYSEQVVPLFSAGP